MKRILTILLAAALMLCTAAFAEGNPNDSWYELSEDECVLTVRLDANATTGYEWTYSFSDDKALELLTEEYVEDEHPEGEVGVGGYWAASFMGTFETAGNVDLTLTYARSFEPEQPARQIVMHLFINEANLIQVISTEEVPLENAVA